MNFPPDTQELPDDLTEQELVNLADSRDAGLRRKVAVHPNTSLPTLVYLAAQRFADEVYENPLLLFHIEQNAEEVPYLLENIGQFTQREERMVEISKSSYVRARLGVGHNEKAPAFLLHALIQDGHPLVRGSAASNANLALDDIFVLINDPHEHVRSQLVKNPSTPLKTLEQISFDERRNVRWTIVNDKRTPWEILARLADDVDGEVRWGVAMNSSTPEGSLRNLAHDSIEKIRVAARESLAIYGTLKK